MSGGLVVRLPFDPGVELVPVDAGAVSHGNAERRPIGTFVVLITVARPCGSRRVFCFNVCSTGSAVFFRSVG